MARTRIRNRRLDALIREKPGERNFGKGRTSGPAGEGGGRKRDLGARRTRTDRDLDWARSEEGQKRIRDYRRWKRQESRSKELMKMLGGRKRVEAFRTMLAKRGPRSPENQTLRNDLIRRLAGLSLVHGDKVLMQAILGTTRETTRRLFVEAKNSQESK